MDLVAVEVLEVGQTVEEGLLATEAKGKEMERAGKEMFVQGVLTRGKAYSDYVDEGHSQRETAKFFGLGDGTVRRYLDVRRGVAQPQIAEQIEQLEDPSLRKMLAIVKPKKEVPPKKEVAEEESLKDKMMITIEGHSREEVLETVKDLFPELAQSCVDEDGYDWKYWFERWSLEREKNFTFDGYENKTKAYVEGMMGVEKEITVEDVKEACKLTGKKTRAEQAKEIGCSKGGLGEVFNRSKVSKPVAKRVSTYLKENR